MSHLLVHNGNQKLAFAEIRPTKSKIGEAIFVNFFLFLEADHFCHNIFFTAYFLTSHCLMRQILVMTTSLHDVLDRFQPFPSFLLTMLLSDHLCHTNAANYSKAFFFFAEMQLLSIGKMLFVRHFYCRCISSCQFQNR